MIFGHCGIMALTVIGGAGPLGRFIIRALAAQYTDVRLGDMYPFRQSVYSLQEQIAPAKIQKHALSYPTSLKLALRGAEHVIVVTHDYYQLAHSKNFFVERTAFHAKELGVKKLTLVCPLGYDQLNPLDGDPEALVKQSLAKAKTLMPNLSILRTNLVFGACGVDHAISYAIEALSQGKSPVYPNNGASKFQPVHENDVLDTLKALKDGEEVTLSGPETLTWADMCGTLKAHTNRSDASLGGGLEGLRSSIAQNPYVGDLFYPSHVQQLYRLLSRDRIPVPTKTGSQKFADAYPANSFKSAPEKFWWRVIVD